MCSDVSQGSRVGLPISSRMRLAKVSVELSELVRDALSRL